MKHLGVKDTGRKSLTSLTKMTVPTVSTNEHLMAEECAKVLKDAESTYARSVKQVQSLEDCVKAEYF